jgi:RNA polymerase sigma factor (sigma-70 family)
VSESSITRCLHDIKAGADEAAQKLWERYYSQLVRLCQKKLGGHRRAIADEEDVALSAFDSFCRGLRRGRFPQLRDRDDLWRLLVVIAARKAVDLIQRENRQRRGGGRVLGEAALAGGQGSEDLPALAQVIGREPTPEFAAEVAEQYELLLAALPDDSLRQLARAKLEGYTNEELAQHLHFSLRTVERKLAEIRRCWSALGATPGKSS